MGKRILYVCGVVLLAILVAPGSLAGFLQLWQNRARRYEAMHMHDQKRASAVAREGRCDRPDSIHPSTLRHRCIARDAAAPFIASVSVCDRTGVGRSREFFL